MNEVAFLYFPTKPDLAAFQEGLKMDMIDCFFNNHFIMEILDLLRKATPLTAWLTDAVKT